MVGFRAVAFQVLAPQPPFGRWLKGCRYLRVTMADVPGYRSLLQWARLGV